MLEDEGLIYSNTTLQRSGYTALNGMYKNVYESPCEEELSSRLHRGGRARQGEQVVGRTRRQLREREREQELGRNSRRQVRERESK